jgi:hypothetical protein
MKKSTIIGQCLLNSRMVTKLEDGVAAVRKVFGDSRPNEEFARWDAEINDSVAQAMIRNVGVASRINVELFIRDLS